MPDVYDRIEALSVVPQAWPAVPASGSPLAADGEHPACFGGDFSTYATVCVLVVDALSGLRAAGALARETQYRARGSHFLPLRPALVAAARAAWILRAEGPAGRILRAGQLIIDGQRQGARAMDNLIDIEDSEGFRVAAEFFGRSQSSLSGRLIGLAGDALARPPRDELLIREVGDDITRYYGSRAARSDVQLLWNVSSSLSHGERWFPAIRRAAGNEFEELLTERSLDVVCSAINVTSLAIVAAAAPRPFL